MDDAPPKRPDLRAMTVTETFFSVGVGDMQRATVFYVEALGATVMFSSPRWSSLRIAGVRIALHLDPEHAGGRMALHLAVNDLEPARAEVERSRSGAVAGAIEVAPGVVIADVTDTGH